mmetsp:Transcript_14307/g.47457  ORF Transcript_14307/g.47457 Transcript_14307/m.47457 type:complete len:210 (+) Transcript_14307:360-989(+)
MIDWYLARKFSSVVSAAAAETKVCVAEISEIADASFCPPDPAFASTDHCPFLSALVRSQSVISTVFSGGIKSTPRLVTLHRYPPSRHVYRKSSGRARSTTGTRPISASNSVPYRRASSSVGNARIMSTGTSSFVRSCNEYSPSDPVPDPKTKMKTESQSGTSSKSRRLLQHTPLCTLPPAAACVDATACGSRENGYSSAPEESCKSSER